MRSSHQKPDVLVHAGDLFDTVKPKTRAYTTVLEALERLHAAGIPLVIIAGNHSMVKTRYTTSPSKSSPTTRQRSRRRTNSGTSRWRSATRSSTSSRTCSGRRTTGRPTTQVELIHSHNNVLVTHGLATAIKDKRLATVAEHELDGTILSDRFDYIALGHYHRQCQITDNAWYSGSTEYLTYGEIADTKGGLIVDPGQHEVRHLELPKTPMADLGTIKCQGMHPGDITDEIIARVTQKGACRSTRWRR